MMVRASKIIRKSIQNFLNNYHSYASIAALLVFPVSASILLSQAALNPATSPVLQTVHARIRSLFDAAGFPPSLQFASLLNLKLAQTACAYLLTLPFTLTFLIAAKATVIQILHRNLSAPPRLNSLLPTTFLSVLSTHLCASLFVLSANATAFSLMFITTNALDVVGLSASHAALLCLSAASAIVYSVILANTLVACNLASVVAGMEDCGGPTAVLKACVLIRGRTATALTLALPANLGMAVVEGLFQYRIVRVYHGGINLSIVWEAVTIAYIYSLLVIFDVVTCCIFYKSCISDDDQLSWDDGYHYRIAAEVVADEGGSPKLKACDMP
ncbi:hypothetical protein QJS04_geneDACA006880 [Acorus gramineus]|uniref:Transmembrane protein n=1 Tax=Acorus gramineus TaxID=55184 RepID=A0AAV9B015_ACOGR|nr:hypothetical protein QJS04_geneDACA006880 [Acorus gramineus]